MRLPPGPYAGLILDRRGKTPPLPVVTPLDRMIISGRADRWHRRQNEPPPGPRQGQLRLPPIPDQARVDILRSLRPPPKLSPEQKRAQLHVLSQVYQEALKRLPPPVRRGY